nr:zinc ABC transporter substrate-binding protein [Halomonas zhangzhouensis]
MVGGVTAAAANPKVVASFSLLGDLVNQVGGNDIELVVLTPAGAEVHEWELTPDNFIALEDVDVVFYNGYQLEQWMRQVYATVGNRAPLIPVAEATEYPTQPIVTGEYTGEPDPHLWMDPRAVADYMQVIADHLAELHPQAADNFQARADAAKEKLAALHEEVGEILVQIPKEQRILITTEAAFVYFAEAYGFRHDGVWGSNAETEGSPQQIMRIVDLIDETRPGALFWESTLSDRYIRSIATDTGVPVAGPLYVDSLSESDGEASNYVAMMRHNANLIRNALIQEESEDSAEDVEQETEGASVSE